MPLALVLLDSLLLDSIKVAFLELLDSLALEALDSFSLDLELLLDTSAAAYMIKKNGIHGI